MGYVQKHTDAQPTLDNLIHLTHAPIDNVNHLIYERVGSHVDLIPEISKHLISSGGKRLRPMLTLASALMTGYQGEGHYKLAASVEFMHTATLLHDDVVDESDLRRGKLAAHKLWGNQASVLVGDFLLGQAFKLMVEVGSLGALNVLSTAAAIIAEGEVLQLKSVRDKNLDTDTYMQVIEAKTAALFSAACAVGPIISDRSDHEVQAMADFGKYLGLAFQLVDDALDYLGDPEQLGKNIGDDFKEGKITLPLILAYEKASENDKLFWQKALQADEVTEIDLRRAINLIKSTGALDATIEKARNFGAMAMEKLDGFPDSPARQALTDTVEFCIYRIY